jgi:hypothetical protein
MKAFDYFEDVDYQRKQVQISIILPKITLNENEESDQEGELVEADAYIWSNPSSELDLHKEWSYENFRKEHLDWYLSNTVEMCRRGLDRLKQEEDSL